MNEYLKCIHSGLYKELKSLRKLTIEEIKDFKKDYLNIFFLLFYEYYEILKDYDNNIFNEDNITNTILIQYIIYCGNLKMLKYCEFRGFTYNSKNINYYFIYSAHNQNIKIFKYLLAKGADINYIHNYRNAYIIAAINNNIKLLKYLEENGININYCDKACNMNVYLHCIRYAKLSTLKYLESRGIDIYKKDSSDRTAYINAIYNSNSIKILKHLESKEFNIFVKDKYNRNALDYCNFKRIHKYIFKKINYISNKIKYKNILSHKNILIHKNNSIKLIYI